MAFDARPDALSDLEQDLLELRVALPQREHGCGLRSRRWVSRMAYAGSLATAASSFLVHSSMGRPESAGLLPGALVHTFGEGAFEDGGCRFARFTDGERIGSDPTRFVSAHAFLDAWRSMREELAAAHDGVVPTVPTTAPSPWRWRERVARWRATCSGYSRGRWSMRGRVWCTCR